MTQHTYRTKSGRLWVIEDQLIYGADSEVATWVEYKLGGDLVLSLFVAIGVLRDGVRPEGVTEETIRDCLVAGAYFTNEENEGGYSDISWTVYSDDVTAGKASILKRVLEYPFKQRKLRRLSAEIDLSNDRAVRQAQRLGFKLEGRKRRKAPGGGDVGVFGLLPEDCPLFREGVTANASA